MVIAITILLGIILLCIVTMAVMVSRAMPYDPAWDDPPEKVKGVNYDADDD